MNWRQRVALLAVLIESLPEKARFSLFDQFRSDIGDFFDSLGDKPLKKWLKERLPFAKELLKKARVSVAARLPVPAMAAKGNEGDDTFTVSFGIKIPMKIAWKFSVNDNKAAMKFSWQIESDGVISLVEAIKGLPVEARYCLWALLDDLLADYEDHLLATEPRWQLEQESAWQEWEMKKGRWLSVE